MYFRHFQLPRHRYCQQILIGHIRYGPNSFSGDAIIECWSKECTVATMLLLWLPFTCRRCTPSTAVRTHHLYLVHPTKFGSHQYCCSDRLFDYHLAHTICHQVPPAEVHRDLSVFFVCTGSCHGPQRVRCPGRATTIGEVVFRTAEH